MCRSQGVPRHTYQAPTRPAKVQDLGKVYTPFQVVTGGRDEACGIAAIIVSLGLDSPE